MEAVDYDALVPIIGRVEVEDALVSVTWRCPLTQREIAHSSANMAADPSMTARVGASVKRSVAQELIYGAARMIAGAVGGAVGRVLSNAVYTAANDINTKVTAGSDYTEASRRAAVVAAFDAVKPSFDWNAQERRFVARRQEAG